MIGKVFSRGIPAAVLVLVLASCKMPEQVRLKASPSIYLPIGDPLGSQLGGLGGLGALTTLHINSGSGSNADIYEYQGPEYGDTRVVMVVMRDLANYDFSGMAAGVASSPVGIDFGTGSFPLPSPTATDNAIDLGGLFDTSTGVLKDYPGLEFRSVPAYLYVNGPARLVNNGNISIY
ncbi:MAG: hypothetical protein LBQ46_13095 [Treponema sp.]|jgi:hypothetical protein|nr:hypothetical protein [Treponema sp.]